MFDNTHLNQTAQLWLLKHREQLMQEWNKNETEINKMKTAKISKDTAKEMIESGIESLKKVAYDTYPELKERELPEKWEDLESVEGFYIDHLSMIHEAYDFTNKSNRNVLPTKELAEAILALCQLLYLREVYRDGWKPKKGGRYFSLDIDYEGDWVVTKRMGNIFSFQDLEITKMFGHNFEYLINKIKPLYE